MYRISYLVVFNANFYVFHILASWLEKHITCRTSNYIRSGINVSFEVQINTSLSHLILSPQLQSFLSQSSLSHYVIYEHEYRYRSG